MIAICLFIENHFFVQKSRTHSKHSSIYFSTSNGRLRNFISLSMSGINPKDSIKRSQAYSNPTNRVHPRNLISKNDKNTIIRLYYTRGIRQPLNKEHSFWGIEI